MLLGRIVHVSAAVSWLFFDLECIRECENVSDVLLANPGRLDCPWLRANMPGYITWRSNIPDQNSDTFCGSDHRKITERVDIFWEKRAKLSCLTSLIDALPRNLSPQRVNRVARSKVEGERM